MRSALIGLLMFAAVDVGARTIVLNQNDTTMFASISRAYPRASWAGQDYGFGFGLGSLLVSPDAAVLLQFPMQRIPKGQRIVRAELIVAVHISPAPGTGLYVWRLLEAWGPGVSHEYRQVRPERLRWAMPGARGPGVDRSLTPTAVMKFGIVPREARLDVTADLQLWNSGVAPNRGWMICTEDENVVFPILPPLVGYPWTLEITYEPE